MRYQTPSPEKAGWTIDEHCAACGWGRTFYYSLSTQLRPRTLRIGSKKVVITESPAAFLARLAAEQNAPA